MLDLHGVDADEESCSVPHLRRPSSRSAAQLDREARVAAREGGPRRLRVAVAFERRGEAERAQYNLERVDAQVPGRRRAGRAEGELPFAEAQLTDGFVSPDLKLAVIPFRRLVHRRRGGGAGARPRALASVTDLRVGDHVVHADHGIARFAGFETKTIGGVTRDYLELSTAATTRSSRPPTSSRRSPATWAPAGSAPQLSALGLEALGGGQGSGPPRGPGARRASC